MPAVLSASGCDTSLATAASGTQRARMCGRRQGPGVRVRDHCDLTDPYVDGVYRWWHLSAPSPELVEAEADGWLGAPGAAVDIGCGLGTESAHLAAKGWEAVGVDLSDAALVRAKGAHSGVSSVQADILALPFAAGVFDALCGWVFDLALDRGCFHYLSPSQWAGYAVEAWRVVRLGGRLLLRACGSLRLSTSSGS